MILSRLLNAGRMGAGSENDLETCCQRFLNHKFDKETGKSDWKKTLTKRQIEYAAADAAVLLPLFEKMKEQIEPRGLAATWDVETRALMAILWMSRTAVSLDVDAWRTLRLETVQQKEAFQEQLDKLLPAGPNLFDGECWNWQSTPQIKKAFATIGIELESTDDEALTKIDHPAAEALRNYRDAQKRSGTYGSAFLEHVFESRVYAKWNQLGAKFAADSPNVFSNAPPRRA